MSNALSVQEVIVANALFDEDYSLDSPEGTKVHGVCFPFGEDPIYKWIRFMFYVTDPSNDFCFCLGAVCGFAV